MAKRKTRKPAKPAARPAPPAGVNQGIQAQSIKAEVMAVGANAQAVQYRSSQTAPQAAVLTALIDELRQALEKVPAAQAAEAKVVAALAKEAVDKALEAKPDRRLLEIKAENLKKAAEGIAQVAPLVVSIAAKIVAQVLQMGA